MTSEMIPKPGQDHDVDLGVAEEPEQVLPQDRRAVGGGVEEVGPEVPVGQQHRDRGGDHRQRDDQQDRVDEDRPDEQRQPAPAHPGRAHVDDRGVEVDRAEQRRDAGQVDQEDPRVLAAAGRELDARQRRVAPPAGLGRVDRRACSRRRSRRTAAARRRARSAAGTPCRARRSSAARSSCRSPPSPARRTGRSSSSRAASAARCSARRDSSVLLGTRELEPHQQRLDPAEHEEHEGRGPGT